MPDHILVRLFPKTVAESRFASVERADESDISDEIRLLEHLRHVVEIEGRFWERLLHERELLDFCRFHDRLRERLRVFFFDHRFDSGAVDFFVRRVVLFVLVEDDLKAL